MDLEKDELKVIQFLSHAQSRVFATTVKTIIKEDLPGVYDRELFTTLGAAAYIDEPGAYEQKLVDGNQLLYRFFLPLIREVIAQVATKIEIDAKVIMLPGKAMPGFHVFDPRANGQIASVHVDEPFNRTVWPAVVNRTASFTLPLELPACGGGLNVWHSGVNPTEEAPCFVEYEIGKIYIHDGGQYHQIANRGDLALGEHRITLQGHVVELDDGSAVFYF